MHPLKRREKPDFGRLLKVLRREGGREYVPFLEMVFEPTYLEPITGLTPPEGMNFSSKSPTYEATFAYYLEACARAGFDHGAINLCGFTGFPVQWEHCETSGRSFLCTGDGMIASEADFDAYRWPCRSSTGSSSPGTWASRRRR